MDIIIKKLIKIFMINLIIKNKYENVYHIIL